MVAVDVHPHVVGAAVGQRHPVQIEHDRQAVAAGNEGCGGDLEADTDPPDLLAVGPDDPHVELVPALHLDLVELDDEGQGHAERGRVARAAQPSDASGDDEQQPFAHLRVVAEDGGGELH